MWIIIILWTEMLFVTFALAFDKWHSTSSLIGMSLNEILVEERKQNSYFNDEDEEIYSLMQTVRVNKKDVDKNYKGEPGKVDTFDSTSRESMERWAARFRDHPKLVVNSLNIWDYELLMRFLKGGVDFPKGGRYENK